MIGKTQETRLPLIATGHAAHNDIKSEQFSRLVFVRARETSMIAAQSRKYQQVSEPARWMFSGKKSAREFDFAFVRDAIYCLDAVLRKGDDHEATG